jgi:hypothetical protein
MQQTVSDASKSKQCNKQQVMQQTTSDEKQQVMHQTASDASNSK